LEEGKIFLLRRNSKKKSKGLETKLNRKIVQKIDFYGVAKKHQFLNEFHKARKAYS